ncbi:MAG: YIP1 family protein [Gammaproteobacteria bacterium]|nr:YIP1 family protein [Gammaproteobacteria bacterium]
MDFRKTLSLIKGMLFEPRATWQAYAAENRDWQYTALTLTLPLIIGSVVAAWILRLIFSGFYTFGHAGTGIVALLLSVVFALAGIALMALILGVFAGVFKGVNDFSKAFACVSLAMVPMYIGQVIGTVPWIGLLIIVAAAIWSLVLLYQMIPSFLAVPSDKRPAHYIVSIIAIIVIYVVLASILGRSIMGAH